MQRVEQLPGYEKTYPPHWRQIPSFGHFIRIGRADDDHPGNRAQRDDLLDRRQI
jgi:hypothetical protein